MSLESAIQSKVIQKEDIKYHILTHTCGIYKNYTDEPISRDRMETVVENGLVDTAGEGEGGMD